MEPIIQKKINAPAHRKRMIRDLPVGMTKYLHPVLRKPLLPKKKKWFPNYCLSVAQKAAINVLNKARQTDKPRVLPFFCDICKLSTRRLDMIKYHNCKPEPKRKIDKTKKLKKNEPHDDCNEEKFLDAPEKYWKTNSYAIVECSEMPHQCELPHFKSVDCYKKSVQYIEKTPTAAEIEQESEQYDEPVECYPISQVTTTAPLVGKMPIPAKPAKTCFKHGEDGIFCFHCKNIFNNFNEYALHLEEDFGSRCSSLVPNYTEVETLDKTALIDPEMTYRRRRHIPSTRNSKDIRCTNCRAGNFSSLDAVYNHMIKCSRI